MRIKLVMIVLLGLSGCTTYVAKSIALAPQADRMVTFMDSEEKNKLDAMLNLHSFQVEVTGPRALLAITVIPPRDYGLEYDAVIEDGKITADFGWGDPDTLPPPLAEPKGTVIVLPGLYQGRYTLLPWGLGLAQQGYRTVLVDLRGQGDSTGKYLTYGIVESRDTRQLVAALDEKGLIQQPLILFGVSYGAATAIMAAPEIPALDAMVALQPYTNAVDAIEGVGRALNPLLSAFVSNATLAAAMGQASAMVGYDLQRARPIDAMPEVRVPVLLIHGQADDWLPPQNSIALYLAKPGKAQLWVIPGAAHMDLAMRYDALSERVFAWLDNVFSSKGSQTRRSPRKRAIVAFIAPSRALLLRNTKKPSRGHQRHPGG